MIGKKISHYHILEKLGEGGMGVVYLAEDARLDRKVAIKFLPSHIAGNSEERKRFEIEAKAAAALNHTNIATIHAIEESDGEMFIVMEYIEGQELKDIVGARHAVPLPIDKVINYATQIAEGLQAAHEKGIVHRDIKSSNIMINKESKVKIMDFGLAKIGSGVQLTKHQSTIGTAAYMSPEQARGEPLDPQSDIWSFGVVLYEMLTGQMPFPGDYEQAVIYSILHEEPKLDDIRDADISAIVKKCLAKDKNDRYQSAAELLKDLGIEKKPSGKTPQAAKTGIKKSTFDIYKIIGVVSVMLLIVVYFIFFNSKRESKNLPPMKTTRLTSYPGEEYFPTLSPDGKSVAFSWNGLQQDNFDIYVKLVDAGNPVRLTTNVLADIRPEWSRDGNYIAFIREVDYQPNVPPKEIYIIPALGGREQKIVSFHPGLDERPSISWSYDNKFIYFSDWSGNGFILKKVSIETHEIEQVTTLPEGIWGDQSPRVSHDGKYVAFLRGLPSERDIFIKNLANNEVHRITHINKWIDGFSWGADNQSILFASNLDGTSALWKAEFSDDKLKKVTGGININNPYLSVQGNRLVYAETIENSNIWKIDLQNPDRETFLIGSSTFNNTDPDISPDGTKILFTSNRTGTYNIWMCDINGENQSQLTFFENKTEGKSAKWSPSGSEILIAFSDSLYIMNAMGGTPVKIRSNNVFATWTKDGSGFYDSQTPQFNIYSFTKEGKVQQQVTQEGGLVPYVFEDYIYYIKDWNYHDIWRIPVNGGEEEPVLQGVSDLGMLSWAVVKNGIYFIRGNSGSPVLEFYNFSTKKISHIKDVPMANPRILSSPIEIDPDEKYLLYSKSEPNKSDIILVENFRVE